MKRFLKIVAIIAFVFIAVILTLAFKADDYVEGRVSQRLKELPEHIHFEYKEMKFNSLKGDLIFSNSKIEIKDDLTDSISSTIEVEEIAIRDINYWEYFKTENVVIQKLQFNNPTFTHQLLKPYKDSVVSEATVNKKKLKFKNLLLIHSLEVSNGSVRLFDIDSDTLVFSSENNDILFKNVTIDSSSTRGMPPFKYESYSGTLNNLFYKISEYEGLSVSRIKYIPEYIHMSDISIKTKYPRLEYDKMLSEERDWYNIKLDSIRLINSYAGKKNDSLTEFIIDSSYVYQPAIEIYRNKLIADEFKLKPFYSEILRNLNFELSLNTIIVENGIVSYEEKVFHGQNPGKIHFTNFYATVNNFGNTYTEGIKTTLDISSNFMETTPLKVNWVFDKNSLNDVYSFKGELGVINTHVLNQFTSNTLNVMLEGVLHKTYFNIEGDNFNSSIDLRINYNEFKIHLINDRKNRPKKLLNAIVNIFIKKDSESDDGNFREASAQVKRNIYGSFYNNIWLNLEAGLKLAITKDSN